MTGSFRNLSSLMNPRSIAVVGASNNYGVAGRTVLDNLRQLNYGGQVYPVNPSYDEILGWPCYPKLTALPNPVDAVAILVGAELVPQMVREAIAVGARAAWVLAVGFAEADQEGRRRQLELAELANSEGLLLCGPNCIGVANLVDGAAMYSVALSPKNHAGSVSVVSQSGAICMGLVNASRFGFRHIISTGNEAVLDSADYIGYLAEDSRTNVIIAFLESIRRPDAFGAAASAAAAAGKPLLVIKVGRSERAVRAVRAHTGGLAGTDAIVDAFFRRYGVVRLGTVDELLESASLLSRSSLPQGNGVGILSLSGGQVGLVADLAQEVNLGLAEFTQETQAALSALLPPSAIGNPLDVWGTRERDGIYERCMELVANDRNIHLIAVSRDTPPEVARLEVEQSLDEAEATIRMSRRKGKPVLMFANPSTGFHEEVAQALDEGNVPYLQGTRETLTAIKASLEFAGYQRKLGRSGVFERSSPTWLEKWRARLGREGGTLNELEGRELLTTYGIEGPDEGIAVSAEEAVAVARRIGFPVVLKILSRDIQHKTDIGGVRIRLCDESAVIDAFDNLMKTARATKHTAQIDGVLVQEMIQGDVVEVILGMIHDSSYGPVIAFGAGGIFVEVARDAALRLPPLDVDEARAQIEETRVAKLLKGVRGRAPADTDALVAALVRFSHLAVDLANYLDAIEINPLMVLPEGRGVRAVDVLVDRRHRNKKAEQCA